MLVKYLCNVDLYIIMKKKTIYESILQNMIKMTS